jgi:hypothetical protein
MPIFFFFGKLRYLSAKFLVYHRFVKKNVHEQNTISGNVATMDE